MLLYINIQHKTQDFFVNFPQKKVNPKMLSYIRIQRLESCRDCYSLTNIYMLAGLKTNISLMQIRVYLIK